MIPILELLNLRKKVNVLKDTEKFETTDGNTLLVKKDKSTIVFIGTYDGIYRFKPSVFLDFKTYFKTLACKIWSSFEPKEATSWASDYDSYYDKEFDNEGDLTLINNGIQVLGPDEDSSRLFRFNKRKAESFVYDLEWGKINE